MHAEEPLSELTADDIEYLNGVYSATFNCLTYFVEENTGLPHDVSNSYNPTSISNIGFYIAALAVGSKTGLISEEAAIEKITLTLKSLEIIDKWHGFPITWVNRQTLRRGFGPSFSYADHVGNLVCGMLVVEGIYPEEFKGRIKKFIKQMRFKTTYDKGKGWLKGGYNLAQQNFDIKQAWGDWYYNLLASDTRQFSLIGITLGQIPSKHWGKLNRDISPWGKLDKEFRDACSSDVYYAPGMEGGGLFMQYMPGIFLPEKNLPLGMSARNIAKVQIEFSKKMGYYPLWGVSASESADGESYIGWGNLKMHVVTPHASVLAISDFPREVVKNLKLLESKGMRPVYEESGQEYDFGFTDAYDIDTGITSERYLSLDQGMLFLSLANFLHDNIVRESFCSSKIGKKAVKKLFKLEKNNKLKP